MASAPRSVAVRLGGLLLLLGLAGVAVLFVRGRGGGKPASQTKTALQRRVPAEAGGASLPRETSAMAVNRAGQEGRTWPERRGPRSRARDGRPASAIRYLFRKTDGSIVESQDDPVKALRSPVTLTGVKAGCRKKPEGMKASISRCCGWALLRAGDVELGKPTCWRAAQVARTSAMIDSRGPRSVPLASLVW